ncbi:hypothetical protein [Streptomyces sp. NPDC059171]|uniref:hypothetical protein n=1 Tax=Streptomyces sp. NPDC059171 TaxID=3346755 RepID=UPI0036782CDF
MTAPGVHDGHPALSASTTKTSKTARSELFINWPWRTWVLLHASQQTDKPALRLPLIACTIRGRQLFTGAVVGIARITGCHQDPEGSPLCSPWAHPGAWHLELAGVLELPLPVPARGQLGPWKPTPHLLGQVFQQLPGFQP